MQPHMSMMTTETKTVERTQHRWGGQRKHRHTNIKYEIIGFHCFWLEWCKHLLERLFFLLTHHVAHNNQ